MVLLLQPGRSLSNLSARDFQNSDIMLSFELDYAKAIYELPSVSIAVSIDTRGVIWNAATEFFVPGACHFRLRKSLIPSHL